MWQLAKFLNVKENRRVEGRLTWVRVEAPRTTQVRRLNERTLDISSTPPTIDSVYESFVWGKRDSLLLVTSRDVELLPVFCESVTWVSIDAWMNSDTFRNPETYFEMADKDGTI